MADQPNQEEEYQFTDFGATDEYTDEDTKRMPPQGSGDTDVMRKRVFMIAGAIIVILIAYNFAVAIMNPPKKGEDQVVKPKTTQNVPSFQQQNTTQSRSVRSVDKSQIDAVKAASTQTRSQLAGMNATISELRQKIMDLDSRLMDLNLENKRLNNEIQTQKHELTQLKQKNKPRTAKKKPKKPVYYVKALIRGRAWLKTENGSTITVKEGDLLTGIGQVETIDPEKGQMIMSNGDVITFSYDDR